MSEKKRKCIFVIGMHRSGTSAMAGALHQLGIPIGKDIMAPNQYNEKGYFENNKVYHLNDEIFEFLGVNWHTTYLLEESWHERQDLQPFKNKIIQILDEEFENEELFLIKDPRISILAPVWIEVFEGLGIEMKWIMMLRHPYEIQESLKRRENFGELKTAMLWMDHMLRSERRSRKFLRLIVDFQELLDNPNNTIREVCNKLQLSICEKHKSLVATGSFIDRGLIHTKFEKSCQTWHPRSISLWRILKENKTLLSDLTNTLDLAMKELLLQIKIGILISEESNSFLHRQEVADLFSLKEALTVTVDDFKKEVATLKQRLEEKSKEHIINARKILDLMDANSTLKGEIDVKDRNFNHRINELQSYVSQLELEKRTLAQARKVKERISKDLERKLQDEERRIKSLESEAQSQSAQLSIAVKRLEQQDLELKRIQESLIFKSGKAVTYPFRFIYDIFYRKLPINEHWLWTFIQLFIYSLKSPIRSLKLLKPSKISVLRKALISEKSDEIINNYQKFLGVNNIVKEQFSLAKGESNLHARPKYISVLYVSPNLPDFDESSGGKRATEMLQILSEEYKVYAFTPGARPQRYVDKLRSLNVEVLETSHASSVGDFISHVDVIIFAWYYTYYSSKILTSIFPEARVIADTVDVHWIREFRSIGSSERYTPDLVAANKSREKAFYQLADLIWTVTEEDKRAVELEISNNEIIVVSNIHKISASEKRKGLPRNILFFGGYQHHPNLNAAQVLAKEIMPQIISKIPDARLLIAGSKAPEEIEKLGDLYYVDYLGFIQDSEIENLYDRALITIVPLTAGAGIKGKICEAVAHDTIVITNDIGNEGIGLLHKREGFITNDTSQMATHAIEVLRGDYDLSTIRKNAKLKLSQLVDPEIAKKNIIKSISPKITICIVTHNRKDLLKDCIESIFQNTIYPHFRVAVYSNACIDGTKEYLESIKAVESRLVTIFSSENEVFVRPNNKMMHRFSDSDIVLLNNDTTVTTGWLLGLWRAAYSNKDIGISGSKILYPNGVLQEFGSELYSDGTGRNLGKHDDPTKSQYQGIKEVGYVSGCSIYIKRSTIKKIGVFDEQFHPCYCEDSDYCYTAWENGIKTVVTSESQIFHYEGATSGTDSSQGFKKYQQINMKKFLRKHAKTLEGINKSTKDNNVYSIGMPSKNVKLDLGLDNNSSQKKVFDLLKDLSKEDTSFVSVSNFSDFLKYHRQMEEVYELRDEIETNLIQMSNNNIVTYKGINPLIDDKHVEFTIPIRKDGSQVVRPNFRESVICPITQTNSRLRATGLLLGEELEIRGSSRPKVYFTEQMTPFFKLYETKIKDLIGSEFDEDVELLGKVKNGIRYEDVTRLSFADQSIDIIVSLEVLEHVPNYRDGLKEFYRCLKQGGTIIMSIPFVVQNEQNTKRAELNLDGSINHILPPEYHGDPVNPDGGILCFYHFGWELLEEMKEIGFKDVSLEFIWSYEMGILGRDIFLIRGKKLKDE